MEMYPKNCQGCRPYNNTCGMWKNQEMSPISTLPEPLAMAYVPEQKNFKIYDLSYGLKVGTIFPELCKPFCGKGGRCR